MILKRPNRLHVSRAVGHTQSTRLPNCTTVGHTLSRHVSFDRTALSEYNCHRPKLTNNIIILRFYINSHTINEIIKTFFKKKKLNSSRFTLLKINKIKRNFRVITNQNQHLKQILRLQMQTNIEERGGLYAV